MTLRFGPCGNKSHWATGAWKTSESFWAWQKKREKYGKVFYASDTLSTFGLAPCKINIVTWDILGNARNTLFYTIISTGGHLHQGAGRHLQAFLDLPPHRWSAWQFHLLFLRGGTSCATGIREAFPNTNISTNIYRNGKVLKAALMFTKSGDNFNFQLKISLTFESGVGNLIILSSQVVSWRGASTASPWRKLGPRSSYHRLYEAARMFMFPYKKFGDTQISWLCEAVKDCFKLWHPPVLWIKYGNLFAPKARNISLRHMFPAAICLWYLWQCWGLRSTSRFNLLGSKGPNTVLGQNPGHDLRLARTTQKIDMNQTWSNTWHGTPKCSILYNQLKPAK